MQNLGMLGLIGYALQCLLAKESQPLNHDWSSSPNANNAWGVNFNNGNDNNNNHVRLVRSGA